MPESATHKDFVSYLKKRIRFYLGQVKIDTNGNIITSYKDRKKIYRILLTLNVHLLNIQNDKLASESDIYKFPFDVLNSQDWDIEHIDSFHTTALKDNDKKLAWIETAMEDLGSILTDSDKKEIEKKIENKEYNEIINLLKEKAGETTVDEEIKQGIGNLALLDSATNRSYGNSLFCTKRRIIFDRIKQGVFIPLATQYVFSKFFDEKGTNRSIWGKEDMEKYQLYIVEMLKGYLPRN